MTENEAIERLKCMRLFMRISDNQNKNKFLEDDYIVNRTAIKSLEEIQHYRSIGTVEECRKARERYKRNKVNNRKLLRDFNKTPYAIRGDCPNCGNIGLLSINTDYCNACGHKLDWSE